MIEPGATGSGSPEASVGPRFGPTTYPREVKDRERKWIESRRITLDGSVAEKAPWVGVGLSGGGIRSATFCLGFFQALARVQLVRRIDLISSVSGGGYFGSFLGTLFGRPHVKGPDDVEATLREEVEGSCRPVENLRQNGRYLSPNGSGDLLLGGAVFLRNWVALQIVLLTGIVAIFLGLQSIIFGLDVDSLDVVAGLTGAGLWWSPWVLVAAGLFAFGAFPVGWSYWMVGRQGFWHPALGLAAVGATGLWILAANWKRSTSIAFLMGAGVVLAVVFTAGHWLQILVKLKSESAKKRETSRAERNLHSKRLKTWLFWTAAVGIVALIDSVARTLYVRIEDGTLVPWLSAIGVGALTFAAFARRAVVALSGKKSGDSRPSIPIVLVATLAALLLVFVVLVACNLVALGFAWSFERPLEAPASLSRGCEELHARNLLSAEPGGVPTRVDLQLAVQSKVCSARSNSAPSRAPWMPFLAALGLAILFGRTAAFLNLSSHQPLYGARLSRAYLGASNPGRKPGDPIAAVLSGDEVRIEDYWSDATCEKGMPIHLINVTVNETVAGESKVQQQDRKGVGLALGPAGLHLGARRHLRFDWSDIQNTLLESSPIEPGSWRTFRPPFDGFQKLSIGDWVGISGAAFSTGTGYRTSLGLSLLAGMANIRLGYWWRPGGSSADAWTPSDGEAPADEARVASEVTKPRDAAKTAPTARPAKVDQPVPVQPDRARSSWPERIAFKALPVYSYLASELLARFPGTSKERWYLSDGGHFENLGGYELIRRRVPRIILLDAECDSDYEFGGLANLVRKARIDFGTEITFWGPDRFASGFGAGLQGTAGPLASLKPRRSSGHSKVVAAIADVHYPGGREVGRLLYVKPAIVDGEPVDIHEYHSRKRDFPHETTADQFFDEAQWESYRKLGEWIGWHLLDRRENRTARLPDNPLRAWIFQS